MIVCLNLCLTVYNDINVKNFKVYPSVLNLIKVLVNIMYDAS